MPYPHAQAGRGNHHGYEHTRAAQWLDHGDDGCTQRGFQGHVGFKWGLKMSDERANGSKAYLKSDFVIERMGLKFRKPDQN